MSAGPPREKQHSTADSVARKGTATVSLANRLGTNALKDET